MPMENNLSGSIDNRSKTASSRIGDFVERFRAEDLSNKAIHIARRAFLDTLAGAIAARNERPSALLMDYARGEGAASTATVWSTGELLSTELAALANGAIGHVLDFDDVSSPMRGHPSVVVFPAVVAIAEQQGLRWDEVFPAFAVGLEVIARIGRVVAIEHVARGWHSTNTLGVIGAAAACSWLLKLDAKATADALGIAVAQAAGTRANFGSMAKSFQAGQAAASAVRACRLAQLGFDSGRGVLDDPLSGFTKLYCSGESLDHILKDIGGPVFEIESSGLDVKKYPNCYATHRAIDGILELRRSMDLRFDSVERIDVRASKNAFVPLIHDSPQTGLEGKFSLQYAMAAAIADGKVALSSFTDQMVQRPAVQAFFRKVCVVGFGESALPRWTELSVTLKNGKQVVQRVESLRGSSSDPLRDADLVEKFVDCCEFAGLSVRAAELAHQILELEKERVAETMRSLTQSLYRGAAIQPRPV
jgi:2-methylcitrate dehydratase PrpD